MNAHILENKELPELAFNKLSEASSVLQVKHIDTNTLIDTKVVLFADDLSLSTQLSEIMIEINDKVVAATKDPERPSKETLSNAIKESFGDKITDEIKEQVELLISTHIDLIVLENVSKFAIEKFDAIFGEDAFESIIKARYGRNFVPSLLLVLKILSFISEYAALFAARGITENMQKIKERTGRV